MNQTKPIAVLAEDQLIVAKLLTILLENVGYQVVYEANAVSALNTVRRLKTEGTPPALLVTDFDMNHEVQTGAWLIAEARKEIPVLPAVLNSGSPISDILHSLVQNQLEADTIGYLQKGGGNGALISAIRRAQQAMGQTTDATPPPRQAGGQGR